MNTISIVGRLVREWEVKTLPSGVKFATSTIAVNRSYGKETDFIPVKLWRQSADFAEKYTHKGNMLSIVGSFQTSSYENKEGKKVTRYEVAGDRIENLTPKGRDDNPAVAFVDKHKAKEKKADPAAENPWELDL